jgi:hypothetical protein
MAALYHPCFDLPMGLKSMKFAAPIAADLQVDRHMVRAKRSIIGTLSSVGSGTVRKLGI